MAEMTQGDDTGEVMPHLASADGTSATRSGSVVTGSPSPPQVQAVPLRFLVFDTETSGLTDNSLPADHPAQPRLAHLAMIYVTEAAGGGLDEDAVFDLYVRPDGWRMQPGATAVNGLTDEFLAKVGLPIGDVLDRYVEAVLQGYVPVAFNAQFDLKVMRGELRRAGRDDLFEHTPNICVMRPLVGVCRIPQKGRGGYKWPKLHEACSHFHIPYERHHRGPEDAAAALEIFRWLRKLKLCPPASVHHSKNYEAIQARQDTTTALRQSVEQLEKPEPIDENVYPRSSYTIVE